MTYYLYFGYDGDMSVSNPLPAVEANLLIPSIAVREPAGRLGVLVVRDLVEAIVTGRVAPGALLPPEAPLSVQFGVSRTVIRESVKRLEEKGLVTVAQGRGTQVNPTSEWNLLDHVVLAAMIAHDDSLGILDELSTVRASLESTMAGDAAQRAREETLAPLREALERMSMTMDDPEAFRKADVDFHQAVMTLSGSRLAYSIARILFDRALESDRYRGRDPEHSFELTLAEHEGIYAAIAAGDPEAARAAMETHIGGSWLRRRLPVTRKDEAAGQL